MRGLRRVTLAAVVLGLVVSALPVSGASATHNTTFCRNEPGDPNEDGITVSDSSGELAFVGYDRDFPPGGGVLVCANVLGFDTNVGYVPGADVGLVRDCSPTREVSDHSCRVSATAAQAMGWGWISPGLDPTTLQVQETQIDFHVTTTGVVEGFVNVLTTSACVAPP